MTSNFSCDLANISKLSEALWMEINNHNIVLLYGEMGVGKTTLVKALCEYKNASPLATSPTYSIVNEYEYEKQEGHKQKIYHLDLYRLKNEDEVFEIGLTEIFKSGAICFIEWPHLAFSFLPKKNILSFEISVLQTSQKRNIKTFFHNAFV